MSQPDGITFYRDNFLPISMDNFVLIEHNNIFSQDSAIDFRVAFHFDDHKNH